MPRLCTTLSAPDTLTRPEPRRALGHSGTVAGVRQRRKRRLGLYRAGEGKTEGDDSTDQRRPWKRGEQLAFHGRRRRGNTRAGSPPPAPAARANTASGRGLSPSRGGKANTRAASSALAAGTACAGDTRRLLRRGSKNVHRSLLLPSTPSPSVSRAGPGWGRPRAPDDGGSFIETSTGRVPVRAGAWTNAWTGRLKKHAFRPLEKRSVLEQVRACRSRA